jgi:hypothetical protein
MYHKYISSLVQVSNHLMKLFYECLGTTLSMNYINRQHNFLGYNKRKKKGKCNVQDAKVDPSVNRWQPKRGHARNDQCSRKSRLLPCREKRLIGMEVPPTQALYRTGPLQCHNISVVPPSPYILVVIPREKSPSCTASSMDITDNETRRRRRSRSLIYIATRAPLWNVG